MRTASTLLCTLVALAWLTGCATTRAEYDREADFSRYQTFAWSEPERREVRDPVLDSELLDRRVERAVRDALREKGFREVAVDEADFIVTYHITSRERVYTSPNVRVHLSYGRGYRYYPHWHDPFYGPYPYEHRSYREGTLIIDIVDREREELVWRSWRASEARQDQFSESQVNRRVERILREFPPARS
ncbi:DUF4136 domain-containing protein [Natronospira bacteriovora]|uniref:DUF4136 domain-containing protein n=1 Tax=Natronospira bacteriovora TaxID=3069753 RepID=A0ABU0W9Z7_9GAMM|nr:DUF4136 domain-containing protein [Natronospira sp. AB-CW4]MDQ2070869.1 DUF4136 domain-containing protein [Natronospira sp. AB-CW4]